MGFINRYTKSDFFNYYYSEEFNEGSNPIIFAVGKTESSGLITKLDSQGNIIWEKEVGFPNAQDYGGGVVRTSWNTYLLVGTTMGDTLPGYRNVAVRHI